MHSDTVSMAASLPLLGLLEFRSITVTNSSNAAIFLAALSELTMTFLKVEMIPKMALSRSSLVDTAVAFMSSLPFSAYYSTIAIGGRPEIRAIASRFQYIDFVGNMWRPCPDCRDPLLRPRWSFHSLSLCKITLCSAQIVTSGACPTAFRPLAQVEDHLPEIDPAGADDIALP